MYQCELSDKEFDMIDSSVSKCKNLQDLDSRIDTFLQEHYPLLRPYYSANKELFS